MTPEQVRKILKTQIKKTGLDDLAEAIVINPDYLRQQANGSRKLGFRVLRHLGLKRVVVESYERIEQ